ncbi:MAG: hypothetical protein IJC50_08470 [Clostridia bacterium]|nr:hypothetical protein [Clostridia bacterium]
MGKRKRIGILTVLFILLAACLVSAVGVTYSRFFSSIASTSLNFSTVSSDSLAVYGGSFSQESPVGPWAKLEDGWTSGDTGGVWNFFVINGLSDTEFSEREQRFNVELVSGVTASELNVDLGYTDAEGNPVTVRAVSVDIQPTDAYYATHGEGKIYKFYDAEGKELNFVLEPGKLSYHNLTLTVNGTEVIGLLDLRVTGEYTDRP